MLFEKLTIKKAATIGLFVGVILAVFADDIKISISPQNDLESARSFVFYVGLVSAIVSISRLYVSKINTPHAGLINGMAWGSTIASLVILESIKWFATSFPKV